MREIYRKREIEREEVRDKRYMREGDRGTKRKLKIEREREMDRKRERERKKRPVHRVLGE